MPPAGAVDELVADHKVPGTDVRLKTAGGGRTEDPRHAELLHRGDVRPVVDHVRGQLVPPPVAREERDPPPGDLSDRDGVAGLAIGRLHAHLLRGLQQRVEPRSPEHADLGLRHAARRPRPS
jgi:hypothetical protein